MFNKLILLLPLLAGISASPINKRATGQLISAGRDGLCLSVQGGSGAALGAGLAVESIACDQASLWDISPGSGSVLVSGSNGAFALDAGSNPGNNQALKIWTSYPGLYQQTWYLTGDKRIAITGGNQCLDEGTNGIQTYQCTTGNTNQIFNVYPRGSTPSSSPSAAPSPSSTQAPPATYNNVLIYPGRDNLCLTPDVGKDKSKITDGTPVVSKPCDQALTWNILRGSGSVVVTDTNFVLDAGTNPGNNGGLKVWQSYPGLYQQTWYYTEDNRIAITGGNQCLDEGTFGIQTYQCTTGNTNQVFYVKSGTPPVPISSSPSVTPTPTPSTSPTTTKPAPVSSTTTSTSTTTASSASATTTTSQEPDPCYGSGGSYSTYTSAGTVTSTLIIPTPSCKATQT